MGPVYRINESLLEPRQLRVLSCLLVRLQVQGQVGFLVKLALPVIPKCAAGVETENKEAGKNKVKVQAVGMLHHSRVQLPSCL